MATKNVDGAELKDLRLQGQMTRSQAAALCGVCEKTYQRWEAGRHHVPWAAYQLIRIVACGELPPSVDNRWDGWRFINGKLWDSLDNRSYTPESIRVWFWIAQQLQHFRQRENQLVAQIDRDNVVIHPMAKIGQYLTGELYHRLKEDD